MRTPLRKRSTVNENHGEVVRSVALINHSLQTFRRLCASGQFAQKTQTGDDSLVIEYRQLVTQNSGHITPVVISPANAFMTIGPQQKSLSASSGPLRQIWRRP